MQLIEQLQTLPQTARPLPLGHQSIAKWLSRILVDGALQPRECGVFGQRLLYLYYGGLFYRHSSQPTRNQAEAPVGFVFAPQVSNDKTRTFPFDSGAAHSGKYGQALAHIEPWKHFGLDHERLVDAPQRLVAGLFGTNGAYVQRQVSESNLPIGSPMAALQRFYKEDLSPHGVDDRQLSIECQFNTALKLDGMLVWMGLPESLGEEFARYFTVQRPLPHYELYKLPEVYRPDELAAMLRGKAYEAIVQRYVDVDTIEPVGGMR